MNICVKKLLSVYVLFSLAMLVTQVASADENTGKHAMRMTTPFPVPYVAYESLSVSEELQMGMTKPATIHVGPKKVENSSTPFGNVYMSLSPITFDVNKVISGVPAISLSDVKGISSGMILLGNGFADSSVASFKKLSVNKFGEGNTADPKISYMETGTVSAKQVNLFPGGKIDNAALPDCDGTVAWRKLTLNDGSAKWFLSCKNEARSNDCRWTYLGDTNSCTFSKDSDGLYYVNCAGGSSSSGSSAARSPKRAGRPNNNTQNKYFGKDGIFMVPDAPCFVQGGSMTELATDCDVFKDLENLEYKEMDAEWRTNFCESAYSGLPIVSESPEGLACSNSREVKVWQSGNNFSASCRPYMCQCDGDTPDPDLPPDDRGECSYEFEYTLQLPTQEMNYGGPNLKAYTCDDAAFDNNITAVSSSPNGQVCSSEGSRLAHSCNVYKCVCPTNSGSGNNENGNTNTGTPGGGGTPCPDMNEQSGTGNTREQYEDSEWIDRCAGKTGGGLG